MKDKSKKDIPGFSDYAITRDGQVWSKPRRRSGCARNGRWLLPRKNTAGYLFVTLQKNKKSYIRTIHCLVLETYKGVRPSGSICRHLDGNRYNNTSDNLKWGTSLENFQDCVRHGRMGQAKLIEKEVIEIRRIWAERPTRKNLAERYGVHIQTIGYVLSRKTWNYIA